MFSLKRNELSLKVISVIVAVIFLYHDISWGVVEAISTTTTTTTAVSTTDLTSSQATAQSTVDSKNAIESFTKSATATSVVTPVTPTYSYYASGRISSVTLGSADSAGNLYYHYLDENWNGTGKGRVDMSKRQTASGGEMSHTYTYYSDSTGRLKEKKGYSDIDWGTLFVTYTFYNGTYGRTESKTLVTPDSSGVIYYHYINNSAKKIDLAVRKFSDSGGCMAYRYYYSGTTITRLIKKEYYSDAAAGLLKMTYTYYDDTTNRREALSYVNPDASGMIYYHYLNENWNNTGYGRIDKKARKTVSDGALSYSYEFYRDSTGKISKGHAYSDAAWGTLHSTYTYYNDATNRKESRTLVNPDSLGIIYYHYINNSAGKYDYAYRITADSNGYLFYRYYYSEITPSRNIKVEYFSNVAGTVLERTSTFYDDTTRRKESVLFTTPDKSGFQYYHYLNNAAGKCDYAYRQAADSSGYLSFRYYYSLTTATRLVRKEYYADKGGSSLKVSDTYFDDSKNKLQSKTLAAADKSGKIYYQYRQSGHVIRKVSSDSSYTEYYYDSQNILTRYDIYNTDGSFVIYSAAKVKLFSFDPDNIIMDNATDTVLVTTANGDIIEYEGDNIISVTLKSNGAVITDIELDDAGDLKNGLIEYTDGSLGVIYAGTLIQLTYASGIIARFRDGYVATEYSTNGGLNNYSYTFTSDGTLSGINTANAQIACLYSGDGKPVFFRFQDGRTVFYESGHLSKIVVPNGAVHTYLFAQDGNIFYSEHVGELSDDSIPAVIYYDSDGNVSSIVNSSGEEIAYNAGLPVSISGLSGEVDITYSFSDLDMAETVTMTDPDGVKSVYDANGAISEVITADDTVVSFDTAGNIVSVTSGDGEKYLYENNKLSAIIDAEGARYTVNDENKIIRTEYEDGRVYEYSYTTDDSGFEITIVHDISSAAYRYYKNDLVFYQVSDLGLETFYSYDAETRIISAIQKKGAKIVSRYDYSYAEDGSVMITDINTSTRLYSSDKKLIEYKDDSGNVYEYTYADDGSSVCRLTEYHHSDGRVIYYKNGAIDYVTSPDGVIIKNVSFDKNDMLSEFTLVLADGSVRNCKIYDEWTEMTTADGVRLFYKDETLAAVYMNNKIFHFTEDELPDEIELYIESGEEIAYDLMSSDFEWRDPVNGYGYYSATETLCCDANISGQSKREVFADFLYRRHDSGTNAVATDLQNKTISFYVKLEEGKLPDGKDLVVEAFAKDSSWQNEYSTPVTITRDGEWYKVEMVISDETPIGGIKDCAFDSTQIRAIGLRLWDPSGNAVAYNGKVYVMDANYTILPETEYVDAPFLVNEESIKPFVGILYDGASSNNPNYMVWDEVTTISKTAEQENVSIKLEDGEWRAQDIEYSQGVNAITWNGAENYWEIDAEFKAGSVINNDGEVFMDFRYDMPGYDYEGPLNLTGKTLTFKVKVPAGFTGEAGGKSWAQVYVKDEEYDYQYGPAVTLNNGDTWYTVTLTPQFGEIAAGSSKTSANFDPTRIINIGVKFSCGEGSNVDFSGEIYLMNATPASVFNTNASAMMVDISSLADYARENDYTLGFEESLYDEIDLAKTHLPNYFKDDDWVMEYGTDSFGKVTYALKGDERVEHYDASGRVVSVSDTDWGTLVTYSYDESGNVTDINYAGTRECVEADLAASRTALENEIAEALFELTQARDQAISEVDAATASKIDQCDNAIRELCSQLAAINDWDPFWPWDKKKKNSIRADIERALQQTRDARTDILNEAVGLYEKIDANIGDAQGKITGQYTTSLALIETRRTQLINDTLNEEVNQLVSVYYSKLLGRAPSADELSAWRVRAAEQGCFDVLDRVAFDVTALKAELLGSDEYAERKAFNANVKKKVSTFFDSYLAAGSDTEKGKLLSALGLTLGDIRSVNQASWGEKDIEAIMSWLDTNSITFGRCAVMVVSEFLKSKGITKDLEEIATSLIVTDILAGAIDAYTEGDLEISLYAMDTFIANALAGAGLSTYSAKIDFDVLKNLVQNGEKVIIHLSGGHFVVVTGIDAAGKVTYFETSNGPNGETVTMDSVSFRMSWTGYALTTRAPPTDTLASSAELLSVRGSFDLLSMIFISISVLSAGLSFIDNAVCQLASQILGLATLAFSIFSLPSILGDFFSGVSAVTSTISEVATKGINVLSNSMSGFVANFFSTELFTNVLNTISMISYNISVTQGLEYLGVDSDLAQFTSSILTGGFFATDSFVAGAIRGAAVSGMSILGREVGLDPFISSLIGTSAGILGSAFFTGLDVTSVVDGVNVTNHLECFDALSYALKTTVIPNVVSEGVFFGVEKFGEYLGVDSRISYLAGIGIRSSLSTGLLSGGNPQSMFQGAMTGLAQGVASISLNYVSESLGLDPLVANLGFSAIASAINGTLCEKVDVDEDFNVFQYMFETYRDNTISYVGSGDSSDLWKQTAYMASVQDFSTIVKEQGIVSALNTYATSFFNGVAVSAMVKGAGSIGQYIKNKLDNGEYTVVTLKNGDTANKVGIDDSEQGALFDADGNFKGLYDPYNIIYGDLSVDSTGKLGLFTGFISGEYVPGLGIYMDVTNGNQSYAEVRDPVTGEVLAYVTPNTAGGYTYLNVAGEYQDCTIYVQGAELTLGDGDLLSFKNGAGIITFDGYEIIDLILANPNGVFSNDDIYFFTNLTDEQKVQAVQAYMLFGNGFLNENASGGLAAVVKSYIANLKKDGIIDEAHAIGIPIYGGDSLYECCIKWMKDAWTDDDTVTDQIIAEIDSWYNNLTEEQKTATITYFSHSGHFRSLIEALNKRTDIKIDTIINYEGPYVGSNVIDNPNLKRIINIVGTAAPVTGSDLYQALRFGAGGLYIDVTQLKLNDSAVPFLGNVEFQSATGIENINFEIIGAKHCDFSCITDDPVNVATNLFMRKLSQVSLGEAEWDQFITRPGISYDYDRKVYVVDPLKFKESYEK